MDRLQKLYSRRNELAGKIADQRRVFVEQNNQWRDDEQRAEWKRVNADYDSTVEQIEDVRVSNREDALAAQELGIGRSATILGGDDDASTVVDRCVAAWARNAFGVAVPREEWEAAERVGIHPGGKGFEFLLNRQRPGVGRELRFAGPQQRGQTRVPFSAGGATVPGGFISRLEKALKDFGPMLQTSEIWVSEDGREAPWPTLNDTGNEGQQIGEAKLVADSDLVFSATSLRSYKFTSGMVKCSHELLRDSALNLAGEIGEALGIRLGRALNRKATVGDGAATLSGIVPAATVGKTAASASVIAADEILDLIASVDPAYGSGPGVGFMMNQQTYAALLKLKTGDGVYLFGGNDKDQNGTAKLLRGYPVSINQHAPDIGAGARSVLFGDLSKYKIRIVQALRLRQLDERYADTDEVGFAGFLEADGALLDAGTHPVKCLVHP